MPVQYKKEKKVVMTKPKNDKYEELSTKIILPDPYINYHLEDCNGKVNPVFKGNFDIEKNKLSTFISKEFSLKNISDAVGSIIGEHK